MSSVSDIKLIRTDFFFFFFEKSFIEIQIFYNKIIIKKLRLQALTLTTFPGKLSPIGL